MTPSPLQRAWREGARIASQYATAVAHEARGKPLRAIGTMRQIALARLRHHVGPRYYSLFEFSRVPRDDWDDYVTDDPAFKKLLERMSPAAARDVANDKALFHRHCARHGLPAIPILALISRSPRHEYANVLWTRDRRAWNEMLAQAPPSLFVKPLDGTFGEGAFTAERVNGEIRFADHQGPPEALFDYLTARLDEQSGWLIQPRLQCHPVLAAIMSPDGIGTIRAVTCMKEGGPRLLLAILKITVGDNVTDNFHHGSTGNLVAPIDVTSGRVSAARGSKRKDWPEMKNFSHHPETGNPIEGTIIPGWPHVVRTVLEAQESLPDLKSTGWDIAITPDGPLLVETNAYYSVDIMQVAYQRGLKRELMRELDSIAPPAER